MIEQQNPLFYTFNHYMIRSSDSFVLDAEENNILQCTIVGSYHRIKIAASGTSLQSR
jgi:hypothetical protein